MEKYHVLQRSLEREFFTLKNDGFIHFLSGPWIDIVCANAPEGIGSTLHCVEYEKAIKQQMG